jgi:hypothetical protein
MNTETTHRPRAYNDALLTFGPALLASILLLAQPARAAVVSTNIIDADGDTVHVSLTGPGTLLVTLDDPYDMGQGPIQSILLNGVTSKSALTVTVKKAGGAVTIENLTANGSMQSINAVSASLSGGAMAVTGLIGTAAFGSLSNVTVAIGPSVPTNATVLNTFATKGAFDNVVMNINGSVGGLTAGQLIDSWVFAGYTPASQSNVMAGGVFTPGVQIRSLTLTGAIPSKSTNANLVNSAIAADRIGSLALKVVQTNNGGTQFGVLANSVLTSVTATKPAFKWNPKGRISQSLGDFEARSQASVVNSTNICVLGEPNLASDDVSSSNLLFDGSSPAVQGLQPGNLLAGGVGKGYLVKVVSVASQNGLVSVQTVPVTLQDVIQEATFDQDIKFAPATLLFAAPGTTLGTNGLTPDQLERARAAGLTDLVAKAGDPAQFVFNYNFDEVELDNGVTLNGSLNLTVTPNLSAQFGLASGLQSFSASVTGNLMADVELSIGDSLTSSSDKVISTYEGEPFLFSIGVVPVVVVPTLELHAGYNASVEAGVDFNAELNASLTAGAQWTKTNGWSSIWTPAASFTAGVSQPSATATLQGYIKPEIVLALYGISGPEIYAQGGATLKAEAQTVPPEVCSSLVGNFSAGVGMDLLSIGNLNISYEQPFAEFDKPILSTCDTLTVTTLPATDVTTNSATLNGEINSEAHAATGYFEWGTTTNYGNATTAEDIAESEDATPLSFALADLEANATYHFRLVGIEGKQTTYGIDQTFSTGGSAGPAFGIGFDDLSTTTIDGTDYYYIGDIPDAYNGFTWNNIGVVDGITSVGSGYNAGTVSPNNVSYNEYANPGSMTSSTPFNLYSAYLTGAWNDGLQVEVQGYAQGKLIYDNTYTANSTSATLFTFNYLGVDEVDFSSSGGTQNPNYNFNGEQFLMDDVAVATNAPLNPLATAQFTLKKGEAIPLTQRIKSGQVVLSHRPSAGSTGSPTR